MGYDRRHRRDLSPFCKKVLSLFKDERHLFSVFTNENAHDDATVENTRVATRSSSTSQHSSEKNKRSSSR